MAEPSLACRLDDAGRHHSRDPFASPPSRPISFPPPCAKVASKSRSLGHEASKRQADTGHERTSSHYETNKPGSMSSGGSSLMTPISSVDLEKGSIAHDPRRLPPDLERAVYQGRRGPRQSMSDNVRMQYTEDDDDGNDDDGRRQQEQHTLKILLFLAGPCVVLSGLLMVWACISMVITTFTQPVRICARRPTFGQQLAGLLGPALNLQLKCIYTPLPPHANEDRSYHAWTLVMVLMLSPFLSLGIMFLAWVLAVYWASSAVVGDPAGLDKRDDGRETVLGLRRWWEQYLLRSVKDE